MQISNNATIYANGVSANDQQCHLTWFHFLTKEDLDQKILQITNVQISELRRDIHLNLEQNEIWQ